MFKILWPGAVPNWVPLTVTGGKARIGCPVLAWKRRGVFELRPIFGGAIFSVESDDHAQIEAGNGLHVHPAPLIPWDHGCAIALLRNGQVVRRLGEAKVD
jgi:hypothetical protein